MATILLLPNQKVNLAANGLISGAYGTFTAPPKWSSSDTTKVVVNPARDGLTCECISLGPTGTATITVTATGTGPLTASVNLTVQAASAGLATSLAISAAGQPKTYPADYP